MWGAQTVGVGGEEAAEVSVTICEGHSDESKSDFTHWKPGELASLWRVGPCCPRRPPARP